MSFFKDLFQQKEDIFIKLLTDQSKIGVDGLSALQEYMSTGAPEQANRVIDAEKDADEVRRILVDEINRTFITPFDREDIYALSRAVDDILDYAKTTVDEMQVLNVQPNEFLVKLVSLLLASAKEVHLAIQRLRDHPNVANEHARRVKELENRVETVYREAIAHLFNNPRDLNDVVSMLKCREIYRHLANAGDRADEAANIISNIVVKTT